MPSRSHREIMVVLIPLMMVLFIATLDQTIVATTIPTIARRLGDGASASWIATGYLLTSEVTTLVFGKLGDMYGRKKIFKFSVVVLLIGSALSGAAGSMGMLIACRALQGIGGGGLSSLVQAIVADLIPLIVGLIGAAVISGSQITRTGHYRIYPIIGAVLSAVGMFLLSVITAATPGWLRHRSRDVKLFGLSLASAVFLDAFVVRSLLLPSVLHLLGPRAWWMPSWLKRHAPRIAIEAEAFAGE